MGQKSSQIKNSDEWKPVDDPCKGFGCRLQQCYEDMMRPGMVVAGEEFCKEERLDLEQCRKEHRLRTHTIPPNKPDSNAPPSTNKRNFTCNAKQEDNKKN